MPTYPVLFAEFLPMRKGQGQKSLVDIRDHSTDIDQGRRQG